MIFVEPENDICRVGSDIFGSSSYLNGGSALKVETRGGVGQTNNRMIIISLGKTIPCEISLFLFENVKQLQMT